MFDDQFGSLWVGTEEGLYRFEGYSFTLRTSQDPHAGLGREAITCIFEDRDLNFWVGAKSGLYRFNWEKKDFDKFSIGNDMFPDYVYQENDTCFLVHCWKETYWFYPKSNRWQKLETGIKGKEIYAIQRGRHNDLWIGTIGKVRKYDLEKKFIQDFLLPVPATASQVEKVSVANMFFDSQEQLWINTWHKGLVKLDTRTDETELYLDKVGNSNQHLLDIFINSFLEDGDGNIWMASLIEGINVFHPSTNTFSYIQKGLDCSYGLIGEDFVLFADRHKNIWVKSDRALHYLDKDIPIPVLKSHPEAFVDPGLFLQFVTPEYVLLGTYFGLNGINLKSGNVKKLNSLLQLPAVHNAEFQTIGDGLIRDDRNIWLCSPQGLRLMQWKDEVEPQFTYQELFPSRASFFPSKLYSLGDSMLLVKGRTNTGTFATFSMRTGLFEYHSLPDSMSINAAIPYHQDTILLAIRNKGLYYYTLTNRISTFIPWKFSSDSITMQDPVFYKIVALQDGSYALCTENYGLMIFNPKGRKFRHIDVAPIANSNRVYTVAEDLRQNLWIQVSNQLLYYDLKSDTLSEKNLANSFKGNSPTFFMHGGKELFFTFEGGLYQVELEKLFFETDKPNLSFKNIRARNESVPGWTTMEQIKLSYARSSLTFEFSAKDYNNPQGMKYWYLVPELNPEWQYLSDRTSIHFGQLAPGEYHFSVKAMNDTGMWSDILHAPVIMISPPFWSTWWFVLGIGILIYLVISYFIKLNRTKREAEIRLRNQIARDLHDDIGSTLSGIKIYSTIASGMSGENKELNSLLQQMRDKSDLMMNSMSDIVWSINPAHDSLHDMMIRLKQYMAEVLESQDVEVHYVTSIDLKNLKIELSHRKELYLALKEIINNAAKYASCRNFYFKIAKRKSDIVLMLWDDGIGMEENHITPGNGLKNIETRITQMGAHFSRKSAPGKGVKYEICIKDI